MIWGEGLATGDCGIAACMCSKGCWEVNDLCTTEARGGTAHMLRDGWGSWAGGTAQTFEKGEVVGWTEIKNLGQETHRGFSLGYNSHLNASHVEANSNRASKALWHYRWRSSLLLSLNTVTDRPLSHRPDSALAWNRHVAYSTARQTVQTRM